METLMEIMVRDILLAEDDRVVREGLRRVLEAARYAVRTVANGAAALAAYAQRRPDLLLLDAMMPRQTGYDVCRAVRATDRTTPILFLTAHDGEREELRALDLGADDFISKTASDAVVLARVAAALRRAQRTTEDAAASFAVGDAAVDPVRLTCTSDGVVQELSVREVEMLRLFATHPDEVFSADFLLTRFWGDGADGSGMALVMQIRRLREKLGPVGRQLACVRGSGYVLRPS